MITRAFDRSLWRVFVALVAFVMAMPLPAAAAPIACRIGAYVTAIYDIDTVKGTFSATVWTWSRCRGSAIHALESQEATNANAITTSLHSLTPGPQGIWEQQKLTGTFRHDFDLSLFPFDRHTLVIGLEESLRDTGGMRYTFDRANSGIAQGFPLDGWRIDDFRGRVGDAVYKSNFGDPALPAGASARYAHLDIEIDLANTDIGGFFKLAVPVYIAAMLALLSLLMEFEGENVVNPRIALLAGLLFAVVFNLQSIHNIVGGTPSLTLMDLIHFAALLLVFGATIAAVYAGRMNQRGVAAARLRAIDRRSFYVGGAVYFLVNVVLIGGAILRR